MTKPRLLARSLLAACALALAPGDAAAQAVAPGKKECIAASEGAQRLQQAGKLRDARAQFLLCAAASCPGPVRSDCTARAEEIDRAMPTVVLEAKDGRGNDLTAVAVRVDGTPLVDHLDGRPVPLDPGQHAFTFEAAGQPPVEQSVVVVQGEKDRHVTVTLGSAPPAAPVPAAPVAPAPAGAEGGGWSGQKTIAVLVAGLGLGGAVVGTIFGLTAASNWSQAQSDCKTACGPGSSAQSELSSTHSAASVSNVAFVVAGLGLVGGGVLFFTAPGGAVTVSAGAAPGGGGVRVGGAF